MFRPASAGHASSGPRRWSWPGAAFVPGACARMPAVPSPGTGPRGGANQGLIMPATTIALVLIGWAALAVGAGIWATLTRDA